jgi:hypothetical protein
MPTSNDELTQVADALNRLSTAMEQLQARHDAAERSNRRVRIVLIVTLLLLGGVMYKALSPIADQLGMLPKMVSQLVPRLKTATLDPDELAAERQRLMAALTPEKRARIEAFEEQQQWVSDYIAASQSFDPGATIALFLSDMAESVKVMPHLYNEVRSMTDEVRVMNSEMHVMNEKMNALPVLSADIRGMHTQMKVLPLLATDIKGMHFYMSIMAKDLDSTMGEAGRMLPWNW